MEDKYEIYGIGFDWGCHYGPSHALYIPNYRVKSYFAKGSAYVRSRFLVNVYIGKEYIMQEILFNQPKTSEQYVPLSPTMFHNLFGSKEFFKFRDYWTEKNDWGSIVDFEEIEDRILFKFKVSDWKKKVWGVNLNVIAHTFAGGLLRKFGPIPIMPDEGIDYTLEYDELATPRSTYEECAEWIASEMLKAAGELKTYRRDESNVMRPTIGAALAVRAIVYTYAASPLANGQLQNGQHPANVTDEIAKELKNFDGTHLLSLTYDESKWARAAAACKDVMDLGVYELFTIGSKSSATEIEPATKLPPDTVLYGPNRGESFNDNFSNENWPNGWLNIDPYLSYRNLFCGLVYPAENPELIFTRGNMGKGDHDNGIGSLVLHSMPITLHGWNTHGLTQKMVDTYYMKDGTDVDGMYKEWRTPGATTPLNPGNDNPRPTGFVTVGEYRANTYPEILINEYQTSNTDKLNQMMKVHHQYAGREPRFYASVAYNGTIWQQIGAEAAEHNKQITYYRQGGDGYNNTFSYLRTGIGVKKYYNPYDYIKWQNSYDNISEKFDPAIRYADILLMYAEALNELTQTYTMKTWKGEDVTISRNIAEMQKGIHPVRIRAGLHDYPAADYADANQLRARIKRERMIEFMAEGKRYFDLRRWMDAPVEENKCVYGLNILQTEANKEDFMEVIPCSNLSATFTDKMYFWPISFANLKHNKNLVQNPGWE